MTAGQLWNKISAVILFCCLNLLLALLVPVARAEANFPADSLRIIVAIDGSDDLHISQRSAKWVHKSWDYPTNAQINGFQWNPKASPVLYPLSVGGLLSKDLDLAGAVLHKLRGRGTVQLGRDADGLVISFDDPDGGADTYEVTLEFAEVLARHNISNASTNGLELRVRGKFDGSDDIWFSSQQGSWSHTGWSAASGVTLNGKSWDTVKNPVMDLPFPLSPEVWDLQNASLKKLHGRGSVVLQYEDERLCLAFDDYPDGADFYEAKVTVPPFRERSLVSVKADIDHVLLGAALKIYRYPEQAEARTLLAGRRVFDSRSRCLVLLEPGDYRFEVLHQTAWHTLVALKTDRITIAGATNINLNAILFEPELVGPNDEKMSFDEISVRSSRPTGDVSWKGPPNPRTTLVLSAGQNYKIHAFGHSGTNYVALWKTIGANDPPVITLDKNEWLQCSFDWLDGTPRANRKGVGLGFPDGEFEVPSADAVRLFTNRRFFTVRYWLAFANSRKAVFQPQGHVLSRTNAQAITLGGPIWACASAAISEKGTAEQPRALSLWWEITLGDARDNLLDTDASKIDWMPFLKWSDGNAAPSNSLSSEMVNRLGNLKDTLVAGATYTMESNVTVTAPLQRFATRHFHHFTTEVPPYHSWDTRTYLAKADRELTYIFQVRHKPEDPKRQIRIGWWQNSGAVGGGGAVTMPIGTYLDCWDWYRHPWAIAHEMLHTFGVGHTREMLRQDHQVQDLMEVFRWHAADTPQYVPPEWEHPPTP